MLLTRGSSKSRKSHPREESFSEHPRQTTSADFQDYNDILQNNDQSPQESEDHIKIENKLDSQTEGTINKSGSNILSQNSSHLIQQSNEFRGSNRHPSNPSFDFLGSNLQGQRTPTSKSTSPSNREARPRITFGPKAHLQFKKHFENESRVQRTSKTGEGSILSFKDFAVRSRTEKTLTSKSGKKGKRTKKKRKKDELTDDSLLSRNSNRTQKKFDSSTEEHASLRNALETSREADFSVEGSGLFFQKKRFPQFEDGGFERGDFRNNEHSLKESKETIKQLKVSQKQGKGGNKKKSGKRGLKG